MISTVKDYTLKQFVQQPEEIQTEYSRLLAFSQPLEPKRTLWELKLKHIDRLKASQLQEFDVIVKTIAKMQKVSKRDVWNYRITHFFRLVNAMKEQLERLLIAEKSLAPAQGNVKWEMVGGSQRMHKYGIYNTLIPLAKQLNKTLEEVYCMEFQEVFTILSYNKTLADLQQEMNDIKTAK